MNFSKIQEQKNIIKNWTDYFKMRSLESLFEESDGIEVLKYQNEIYRIDTTDAFTLTYFACLVITKKFSTEFFKQISEGNKKNRFLNWKLSMKNFVKNYGKKNLKYFIEPFYSFLKVPSLKIEKWSNTLNCIYPKKISLYYQRYFKYLKLDVQDFIKENQKYFE